MLSTIAPFGNSKSNEQPFSYTAGDGLVQGAGLLFDFTGGQMRTLTIGPFLFNGISSSSSSTPSSETTIDHPKRSANTSTSKYTDGAISKRKRGRGKGHQKNKPIDFSFPIPSPIGNCLPILPLIDTNNHSTRHKTNNNNDICHTTTIPNTNSSHPLPAWSFERIPLGIKEDTSFLYKLQAYLRSTVVEAFGATEQDVITAAASSNETIGIGQVGIRCRHCCSTKGRFTTEQQQKAHSFPTTLDAICKCVEDILDSHVDSCPLMPDEVRTMIDSLKGYDANLGPREWYWVDSAKKLGLIDTPYGVRFGRDPKGRLPALRGPSAEYMNYAVKNVKTGGGTVGRLVLSKIPSMPYIYTGGDINQGCGNVPKDVRHVIVHNSVTHIDAGAFESCQSLTTIELPDSVVSIGVKAFDGCSSLTNLHLPERVTSVGHCAFSGCSSLMTVQVSENLVYIGADAFRNCTSLTVVGVSSTGTDGSMEGHNEFEGGPHDDTDFTQWIERSRTTVGERAFSDCTSLTSVTLSSRITTIGECVFSYCSSLTSLHLPSLICVPINAFELCHALHSINAPSTTTTTAYNLDNLKKSLTKAGFSPYSLSNTLYNRPNPSNELYYHNTLWKSWAITRDIDGRLPLTIAATRSLRWKACMEEIFVAHMPATYEVDESTGLSLFMLAGVGGGSDLEAVYRLLREFPPAAMIGGWGVGS